MRVIVRYLHMKELYEHVIVILVNLRRGHMHIRMLKNQSVKVK